MSYVMSQALQQAIYAALTGDATLQTLVGAAIFDAPPAGSIPSLYISLGPEVVRDRSATGAKGARHDFTISVVTDAGGFDQAKQVAAAISDRLVQPLDPLARGRVVALNFLKARARRDEAGQQRRIDMVFRALLDDD